jgi:hypothetical protein
MWKAVTIRDGKYIGKYEVSEDGKVRSAINGRFKGSKPGTILKQVFDEKGYLRVNLYFNAKGSPARVHRIVAEAFLGDRPEGMTVNHIDGNKVNNHVENLEYVSNKENIRHAHRVIETRSCIEVHGEKLCIPEAMEKYGNPDLKIGTVESRIHRLGWNPEDAIKLPSMGKGGDRRSAKYVNQRQK